MSPAELRAVLRRHGLTAGRRLGQHFLCDPVALRRIVEAAEISPDDLVLEVGPGVGVLTRELVRAGGRVTAVELDRALRPALLDVLGWPAQGDGRPALLAGDQSATLKRGTPGPGRMAAAESPALERGTRGPGRAGPIPTDVLAPGLRILWADAVKLAWPAVNDGLPGPWRVCSNLPYYITGPFLASLFAGGLPWSTAVLLVQAEAAARMAAAPGIKAYGAFTCLVGYHATVERVLAVPRRAFLPPPAVDSTVVRLRRRLSPPTSAPRGALLRVVRAAFAQRRKTLRNALAAALPAERAALAGALAAAGIAGERRGETLDLEEFGRLTEAAVEWGLVDPTP